MALDFSPVPAARLFASLLAEYEATGEMFGIPAGLFFSPAPADAFALQRYGVRLETPLGVAAGPHTQLAQNIVAAWLTGARYLELKTVQTLDELTVARPCIDIQDEGYNCEWSQELKLRQSFDEYLTAWVMVHALRSVLGHKGAAPGCIFNMSVGYNLEGVKKPNVQEFLSSMKDASAALEKRQAELAAVYPPLADMEIPSRLSDSVTLSTMHGCPPDEIEKIALYLISDLKLNTTVKLNPTLLGPVELRRILNDELGFPTVVPDEAFGHDLKYPDAVKLIGNLRTAAAEAGVAFGLKLTNTLESENNRSVFPPTEKMMYMSGRALHPVSVNVARKLQREFKGELDVSFSAGADAFNLPDLLACGLRPVTVCSDALKPGGYGRLSQYLEILGERMRKVGAGDLDALVSLTAGGATGAAARLANLERYADEVRKDPRYRKDAKRSETIKTGRALTLFDCVAAPCRDTCPASQDIPEYMARAAAGDFDGALQVIMRTNPFPNVLGSVCDHQCQGKCTRLNYDASLLIREVKRFVAEQGRGRVTVATAPANGKSVAVVGAGPSGLACAFFLAQAGYRVRVLEAKPFGGGMTADAIPSFRLQDDAIKADCDFIASLGVEIEYGATVDRARFERLRKEHDYVYVAVGAQKARRMRVEGEDAPGVVDCLALLSDVRRGRKVDLGDKVAVVGGGNSAMDAARTARRLVGAKGKVVVLYRRTRHEMPADRDEVEALEAEGVELRELTAPVAVVVEGGRATGLRLVTMKLGDKDVSGRARPVPVEGSEHVEHFTAVVTAIGQDAVVEFVDGTWVEVDPVTGATAMKGVYAGGDAARGASTVVWAVADARRAAAAIARGDGIELPGGGTPDRGRSYADHIIRRSRRVFGVELPETGLDQRDTFAMVHPVLTADQVRKEAERCVQCDEVCSICVTVCPNRANRTYRVDPAEIPVARVVRRDGATVVEAEGTWKLGQGYQVVNLGEFCNGCGNCTTFCPSAGAPFQEKPTLFLTKERFEEEETGYHLSADGIEAKVDGRLSRLVRDGSVLRYESEAVVAQLEPASLRVVTAELRSGDDASLRGAAELAVLLRGLAAAPFL